MCRPQILRLRIFFSFVGDNPTLKNYKGERCRPHILRLKIFFLCGRQSHIGNLQESEASLSL